LLHVFDMDGTLLRGTTAGMEIARRLDCLPRLLELEELFAAGTLDTRGFSTEIARLWQADSDLLPPRGGNKSLSALTAELVAEVFDDCPWIGGLPEVLADIAERGEHSLVITMSPDFFANHLRRFGFAEVAASRFPPLPLRELPDPAGILTPADKVRIVGATLTRLGLTGRECLAYGDSGSDLPLFGFLPHTVAVNASPDLEELAAAHYRGDDLLVAYRLGRELLSLH
jgi:phosphoserine phosphatase